MQGVGFHNAFKSYVNIYPKGFTCHVVILTVEGHGLYHWHKSRWQDCPRALTILPMIQGRMEWLRKNDPWKFYWMTFQGKGPVDWAQQFEIKLPCCAQKVAEPYYERLVEQFESVISLAQTVTFHDRHAIQRDGLILFTRLLEVLKTPSVSPQTARIYGHDLLSQVDTYLQRRNPQCDRVSELAEVIHVSSKHISRVLKAYTGLSMKEYFIMYRIRQAKQLLLETDLPIKEVGAQVSYPDPYHFSKLFRQFVHVSPSSFRRRGGMV